MKTIVDYEEILKLATKVKKVNDTLESIVEKTGPWSAWSTELLLRKDNLNGLYGSNLKYLERKEALDKLFLYLYQLGTGFKAVEEQISRMNSGKYQCSDRDIIEFANHQKSKNLFISDNDFVSKFLNEIGFLEILKMLINEGASVFSFKSPMGKAFMKSFFTGEIDYDGYKKRLIKEQISRTLIEMTDENDVDFELNKVQKKVIEFIFTGKGLSKEEQNKNKNILKFGKAIAATLNYYSEDVVKSILIEYQKSVAVLESLKELDINNEIFNQAVDEMIKEYSDKFYRTCVTAADNTVQFTIDKLVSDVSIFKYAKLSLKALDAIAENSDYNSHAQEIIVTETYICDLTEALNQNLDKIRNGQTDSKTLTQTKNLFDMIKTVKISQYDHLIAIETEKVGDSEYYKNKAEMIIERNKLASMTMNIDSLR